MKFELLFVFPSSIFIFSSSSLLSLGLFSRVALLGGSALSPQALVRDPETYARALGAQLNCTTLVSDDDDDDDGSGGEGEPVPKQSFSQKRELFIVDLLSQCDD